MMSSSPNCYCRPIIGCDWLGTCYTTPKEEVERLHTDLEHEKSKRKADRTTRIQAEKSLNKKKKRMKDAEKGHTLKAVGYIESPLSDRRHSSPAYALPCCPGASPFRPVNRAKLTLQS